MGRGNQTNKFIFQMGGGAGAGTSTKDQTKAYGLGLELMQSYLLLDYKRLRIELSIHARHDWISENRNLTLHSSKPFPSF